MTWKEILAYTIDEKYIKVPRLLDIRREVFVILEHAGGAEAVFTCFIKFHNTYRRFVIPKVDFFTRVGSESSLQIGKSS